ncbi:sigma-54-dependent transcriptional regulator [Rhodopirellula sp. SWK7]|uniref:sigma-54-dependent transcriptional regulator n=1 Tax=Rhodopirellula sp. SWK7 TaxID=595460 RepID=UPI0002BECFB6|nr:sigma-54 dependent transcriptional regulator [Rhodopirellula sp. SWK7]EMI43707.1 two component, sigma54 specific, transcriptional regulator, Fis family [Rhodopirellula sp. SWK7]
MNDNPLRLLIADDEPLYRNTTAELLRDEGFECLCVADADDAIDVLKEHPVDLVLTDLNMPGNLRLELLKEGRSKYSHIPMIVVTGVPSMPTAIESVRLGIADYLLKPVKFDELLTAIQRATRTPIAALRDCDVQTDHADLSDRYPEIIGRSPPMISLLEIVDRVAASNTNVLITGESGTGKEVIAKAIHRQSPRRNNAFQVIDCTAIPELLFESVLFGHVKGAFTGATRDQKGLLENCDGGTAFFDELGELPAAAQAKLLRAIQEQTFTSVGETKPTKIDTRFICATNRDLHAEVDAGRFRQDLYYRMAVIHIELAPLRERGDDIVLLAESFLKRLRPKDSGITGFRSETIECLRRYDWPGNIRELRNVIERAIALARGREIGVADLPKQVTNPESRTTNVHGLAEISRDEALDHADREYLKALLDKHDGVIASAARQAGMSRQGLNKLLKRHGIDADDFR